MSVLQDIRFAVRLLKKDRWFTAVATLALAVGIGANTTVFTLVNALLIRGLPFDDPDRLMYVGERDIVSGRNFGVSWLDFQAWRDSQKSFVDLAAWSAGTMNVSDEGRTPERYAGVYLSANAFTLLAVRPILGRDFLPEDDKPGANPVVILGNGIWKSRYGLDPSIIGRTIRVNEVTTTVVGVMPEGMRFLDADLWMPLTNVPGLAAQPRTQRFGLQAFGRLAPHVSRQQAQTEFTAIAARLERDHAGTNANIGATVMTFNERVTGGPIRQVMFALMGAVGFVLLIACANVANLLLVRSTSRVKEVAVRVSIGATRWRIVRQLLVESLLIAAIGGFLGWLLAIASTRWFDAVTQDLGRPFFIQFVMDGRVFAFFATVCLATVVIFGLAPALHISKTDVNDVIKGGRGGSDGPGARRWTGAVIVAELTLTLVLLAGAGFMMRSFLALYRLDPGIETAHLLIMNLSLPDRKYPTPERRAAFYQRLEERIGAMSTIRGTIASNIPLGGGAAMRLTIDGRPAAVGETAAGHARDGRIAVLRHSRVDADSRPRVRRLRWYARPRSRHRQSTVRVDAFRQRRSNRPPDQADARSADGFGAGVDHHSRGVADCPAGQHPGTGSRSGRLRALSLRRRAVHVAVDPHRCRAVRDDKRAARGSPGARSRLAALRDHDDESGPCEGAMVLPRVRHDVPDFRLRRARTVGGGPLRDHGILGRAAHAGDRRPDGARRRSAASRVVVYPAIVRAARDRPHAWNGGCVRRRPFAPEPARSDEHERSADAGFDRDAIRGRLARRVLLAGATGDRSRSDQRVALRVSHRDRTSRFGRHVRFSARPRPRRYLTPGH